MDCDRYLELLALRLDGALTEAEEVELEAHLAACPACRAAGAQLAALRSAFDELEETPVPEGFAQGVMERIQTEAPEKKVIFLFRRSQWKALAGLAACLALAVGLYSMSAGQKAGNDALTATEVLQDVGPMSGSSAKVRCVPDMETEDYAYKVTQFAGTGIPIGGTEDGYDMTLEEDAAIFDSEAAVSAAPLAAAEVLTVERMPEGGWELIPPETPDSPEGLHVTKELLEQVGQLAVEQGISASITSDMGEAEEFIIVVLEETK